MNRTFQARIYLNFKILDVSRMYVGLKIQIPTHDVSKLEMT